MKKLNFIKFIIHSYVNVTKVRAAAVKAAAASSNFNQSQGHKPGGYKLYKYLTAFVCLPGIALVGVNTYMAHQEEHHMARPEYIPYDYLCVRNKRFPWGDGSRSLFHNPKKNALKEGYEE